MKAATKTVPLLERSDVMPPASKQHRSAIKKKKPKKCGEKDKKSHHHVSREKRASQPKKVADVATSECEPMAMVPLPIIESNEHNKKTKSLTTIATAYGVPIDRACPWSLMPELVPTGDDYTPVGACRRLASLARRIDVVRVLIATPTRRQKRHVPSPEGKEEEEEESAVAKQKQKETKEEEDDEPYAGEKEPTEKRSKEEEDGDANSVVAPQQGLGISVTRNRATIELKAISKELERASDEVFECIGEYAARFAKRATNAPELLGHEMLIQTSTEPPEWTKCDKDRTKIERKRKQERTKLLSSVETKKKKKKKKARAKLPKEEEEDEETTKEPMRKKRRQRQTMSVDSILMAPVRENGNTDVADDGTLTVDDVLAAKLPTKPGSSK